MEEPPIRLPALGAIYKYMENLQEKRLEEKHVIGAAVCLIVGVIFLIISFIVVFFNSIAYCILYFISIVLLTSSKIYLFNHLKGTDKLKELIKPLFKGIAAVISLICFVASVIFAAVGFTGTAILFFFLQLIADSVLTTHTIWSTVQRVKNDNPV